jgi:phage/plasmid-like protein (TIGR03299 family)
MAHEIRSNDSLVLARTSAWHGLGRVLPDTVTPTEALTIGRLDWMVEESVSLAATFVGNDGSAERAIVESHKTLRRSDDKSILATVGADYCVLQNTRLAEIATALGSEGAVRVESAGSLFGGRKVFFLLHANTLDIGARGDIVEQYCLLANAHDGTMSATALPTSVRVVCNNTLTAALGATAAYRWRHTSGLALRVEDIKAALAAYGKVAKTEADAMNTLAGKSMTRAEIQSLWTDVLVALDGPIAVNPKDEAQSRRKQRAVDALADMTRVFDREQQQFGATAWVAANAATNYIQFHRGHLKGEARQNADLFGAYADAKRTVMSKALALV